MEQFEEIQGLANMLREVNSKLSVIETKHDEEVRGLHGRVGELQELEELHDASGGGVDGGAGGASPSASASEKDTGKKSFSWRTSRNTRTASAASQQPAWAVTLTMPEVRLMPSKQSLFSG